MEKKAAISDRTIQQVSGKNDRKYDRKTQKKSLLIFIYAVKATKFCEIPL